GTVLAGSYAIREGMRLSDLLKAPGALGTSPYTIFGIVARRDPRTYLRSPIAFSPVAALAGDEDFPLRDDDIVRVFSMREAKLLSRAITQYEKKKQHNEEAIRNPYLASTEEEQAPEYGAAGPAANGLVANQAAVQARENANQGNGGLNGPQRDEAMTTSAYQSGQSSIVTGQNAPLSNEVPTLSGANPAGTAIP